MAKNAIAKKTTTMRIYELLIRCPGVTSRGVANVLGLEPKNAAAFLSRMRQLGKAYSRSEGPYKWCAVKRPRSTFR